MKQIVFQPKEEIDLNDRLVNLYGSKLVGLYTDLEPLFEREGNIKPSLPLLLWLLDDEAYKKADVKVMIFGRETNNWNDARRSNLPNGTYNFGLETSDDILGEIMGKHDSEDEIYGICDTYESYCAATAAGATDAEVKPTQFTRRFNQLVEKLKQSMPGKKWRSYGTTSIRLVKEVRAAAIAAENRRLKSERLSREDLTSYPTRLKFFVLT